MEVSSSFTVKSKQPLSPVSCIPSVYSQTVSLQRQFFGHELRPPGGLRRRKCNSRLGLGLGFKFQSPLTRRTVRTSAALDAQTVMVVVSFVAVSALTVFYVNYSQRKNDHEFKKKISNPLDHMESQQSTIRAVSVAKVHTLTPVDIPEENSDPLDHTESHQSTISTFSVVKDHRLTPVDIHEENSDPLDHTESRQSTITTVSVVKDHLLTPVDIHEENSDPLDHMESRQSTITTVSVVKDHLLTPVDILEETFARVSKDTEKECNIIGYDSQDELGQDSQEAILLHEEDIPADTLVPLSSHSTSSSIIQSSSLSKVELSSEQPSKIVELSFHEHPTILELSSQESPSSVLDSGALPFILATGNGGVCVEKHDKNEQGSELPILTVDTKLTACSVPAKDVEVGDNVFEEQNYQRTEESDNHTYDFVGTPFSRNELYKFYEANHSAVSSMGNFNGTREMSCLPSLKNKSFSSPVGSSMLQGTKISAKDSLHSADVEAKLPHEQSKRGPFHEKKDFWRVRESNNGREKGMLNKDDLRSLFSHLKEESSNSDYSLQQLSAYRRFLREGRLIDCLEKLEHLERKGLLDMDKIYHAGFYRVCKNQRAVKEAFRFTNLIRNPTLSTFNMLMSVCAWSQDLEGAFAVLQLVQKAGLKADCKLYTTLLSTCARSEKVDTMFKVFHGMVNSGVEPNVHTYGTLIDGCAKAGQVAKAFGAYGIMRSKNVKPDRVVFNALISACGNSGAVDRAFDVLSEMMSEARPIDPDHITVGALMKACVDAGQVERARETYSMIKEFNIKGTPEVYTIAVSSCSGNGDWEFACSVFNDMTSSGVIPDEMFFSALIDVAGHAGKLDAAFEILQEAQKRGIDVGIISYSSMMGACSNAKDWQKALELYEEIKSMGMKPVVSMMNALITALCDGDQLPKALEILSEMKKLGLHPDCITYSILLVASEKKDNIEVGLMLLSQAKQDHISPSLVMCRSLTAMFYRRFEKACMVGEPIMSLSSGRLLINSKWTSLVLMIYRETVNAGVVPTMEELSQVLGCLRLPQDSSLKTRLVEDLGVIADTSKGSNLFSFIDGFGEYDPRAFPLVEEAASLGIVPSVSLKESPIVVDLTKLPIYTAEVYFLTVLKGLKYRLAAGVKLPNLSILLPIVKTKIKPPSGEKTIHVAGRITQTISALLRRLRISYIHESAGKIRINGIVVRKWLQPEPSSSYAGKPTEFCSFNSRLGKKIRNQQRNIRSGSLSIE